ncbi:uncharacterized protein MELLADRAFT_107967 [Melampsora larici-populina 98AG31]|uniref:Uncharacterized protein n=1 Tax=Melampsora larici-populina (strain 98AG31 / pathotype 3-4-7) TaxID=747676 RepID=F4RRJ4_MELLP|nr:uncharacterized protein MELLADRAFT_107967 [Melampsora larici-populina 98AG31]EGG04941.1 hypothetical protein MELLADRAFT_107967 [Melampsora larici-populina 98AG31]
MSGPNIPLKQSHVVTISGVVENSAVVSDITACLILALRRTMPDEDDTKSTLCFVMKHIDYQPQSRKNQYFEIEYRIRPTRNMEKSQNLVHVGRETLISGYIVDWDSENNRWIVEVTAVSPCTGNEGSTGKTTNPAGHVTPAGRVRPAKHVPGPATPVNAAAGPSSTPASVTTNGSKRKASALEEPLHSPPVTGRRTRPAKHVAKPTTPAPTKPNLPKTKGKGKAVAPAELPQDAEPDEELLSETEWPTTPVTKVVKKAPAKKAVVSKAKKAKAVSKEAPIAEETHDDDEVEAEEDSEEDLEE